MAHIRRKIILTGGRAGQTVKLGNYQFVDGVSYVTGDGADVDGICAYLGRCYKAWPEGSQELKHFQRLDLEREAKNGTGQVHATAQQGQPAPVPGGVRSDGSGPEATPAGAGTGAAHSGTAPSGSVPGGDGHGYARDAKPEEFARGRLVEALRSLDYTNDEHWTTHGKPRMDAVEKFYGSADVNRTEVEMALPGFNRDVARERAA